MKPNYKRHNFVKGEDFIRFPIAALRKLANQHMG